MTGMELLYKMELTDPSYVEAADEIPAHRRNIWASWVAAAACFCLVVAAAVVIRQFSENTPAPPGISKPPAQTQTNGNNHTEGPWIPWTAYYNEAETVMDAARMYIPGYFTEELNQEELDTLEPGMRIEWMQYSGYAGFDGEGTLMDVHLNVTTSIPDTAIAVSIRKNGSARDYVLSQEPVLSVCENTEYTVYQWESGDGSITLAADALISGISYGFTLKTTPENLLQAKEDFNLVLNCFAYYPENKPDLAVIVPEEIPEWFDNSLSHSKALEDLEYGHYMLRELPPGFTEESIRRYKDQTTDYLSGLWVNGYCELRWKVRHFTESDASRLTDIQQRENYDLSLYPIPRAESVPEDLYQIVDNPIFSAQELTLDVINTRAYQADDSGDSDGLRMDFSVKYEDILIEVRTKGVDPEWVYQQLAGLIPLLG